MEKGCFFKTYSFNIVRMIEIDYLRSEYFCFLDINNIKSSRKRFHPDFNTDVVEISTTSLPKINANFSLLSEESSGEVNDSKSNSKY